MSASEQAMMEAAKPSDVQKAKIKELLASMEETIPHWLANLRKEVEMDHLICFYTELQLMSVILDATCDDGREDFTPAQMLVFEVAMSNAIEAMGD